MILVLLCLALLAQNSEQNVAKHVRRQRQIEFQDQGDTSLGFGALSFSNDDSTAQPDTSAFAEVLGETGFDIFSRDGFAETRGAKGNQCQTPFGRQGTCSYIYEAPCDSILNAVRILGVTTEVLNYLRQAIQAPCGFDTTDYTMCCETSQPITPKPSTTAAPTTNTPCGVNDVPRIVHGSESVPGSWPWAVIVGRSFGPNSFQVLCGGSIISSKYILTAAHCFVGQNVKPTHVRAGEHDVSTNSDNADPVDIGIKNVVTHQGFTTTALQNDIAVIELESPLSFRQGIKPVCLPSNFRGLDLVQLKNEPVIVGWGSTVSKGATVNALREATVKVVSRDSCASSYSSITRVTISENQVCAGTGKTDTCNGDSGGPMLSNEFGRWALLGITSYGVECASATHPGVYTRVDKFLDWITQNTQ